MELKHVIAAVSGLMAFLMRSSVRRRVSNFCVTLPAE